MERPKFRKRNILRSRALRRERSPAERILWSALARKQLGGHHFTTQYQIGPCYADFTCRKQKLIVEADGASHDMRQDEDKARDAYLEAQGYRVMRFTNEDIMQNLDGVLCAILSALEAAPSPNPSRTREGDS